MVITRFGISLEKLKETHLDSVREWRNQDFVRAHMQYSEVIDEATHRHWWAGLDAINNWYFIGSRNSDPIGVFHIKNINWKLETGEAGAFVSGPEWVGHPDTAMAILAIMDFAFFVLGLKILEAVWNPTFADIDLLNTGLGYTAKETLNNGFIRGVCSSDSYLITTKQIRFSVIKLRGDQSSIKGTDPWLESRMSNLGILNNTNLFGSPMK